jgi:hypothetical protein
MIPTSEIVHKLQNQIRGLERPRRVKDEEVFSSGCDALDHILPLGGFSRGSLIEWLSAGAGSGAATLALLGARQACRDGGALVVPDRSRQVYPPAIAAWGINLARVILVYPKNKRDQFWTWDQALRCPGVAVVWGWVDQLDSRQFRRLQLSAEKSDSIGLLIRPIEMRSQPTWADVRLLVEPRPSEHHRRMRVEVLRSRGGADGEGVQLELDEWTGQVCEVKESKHETHSRALAAQLARAKTHARPTGTHGASHRAL